MDSLSSQQLDALWAHHHGEWRDPMQVSSQWREAANINPRLLQARVQGQWWETLATCGITILVTREYEHLVMAMSVVNDQPLVSYMPLPHPSGLVVDRTRHMVSIASTRNPNQVYDFKPVVGVLPRLDMPSEASSHHPLVATRSRFFPGCLYIHDLALIGGHLHANAVGHNAIVRMDEDGGYERVWWPHCIETADGLMFGRNHLQLNSIAAGDDVASSFYSASTDHISARRPGHKNFPVDRRGVIFDGNSREPVVRGLTRPHSARLYDGQVWVDNSGYGEFGICTDGGFERLVKLPGWTRGLCFCDTIAFVGTSRVIPRFRQYAPGLAVERSVCGIHAIEVASGKVLGSIVWQAGNQIFALDYIDQHISSGFPFIVGKKRATEQEKRLFYAFQTKEQEHI